MEVRLMGLLWKAFRSKTNSLPFKYDKIATRTQKVATKMPFPGPRLTGFNWTGGLAKLGYIPYHYSFVHEIR